MRTSANGITLHVLEAGASNERGTRPTLVFLHYFGGSSRSWSEVADRLADDFHCIMPDLRGFGASDAPTAGYTMSDYADDIAALIKALGINRFALVGHSMGGKIALLLASRRAPGLASLTLLAPSPPTPEPMEEAERKRLRCGYGDRATAEETLRRIFIHAPPVGVFNDCIEDNLRTSSQAWFAWLDHGSREDISAEASKITSPVLVVAGENDPVITSDMLEREVVRRIKGAHLSVVTDAGHLFPLEAAGETARLIRRQIES